MVDVKIRIITKNPSETGGWIFVISRNESMLMAYVNDRANVPEKILMEYGLLLIFPKIQITFP